MSSCATPVLFLIFNRPAHTARVFEVIRQAQPERLYVAADGPRPGREGELELCQHTRAVVDAVDWPCHVERLYRSENLGCGRAVSGALDWVFSHEESAIILEDDCLPHPHFFTLMSKLLGRLETDHSIGMVGGVRLAPRFITPRSDFYTSRHVPVWGWATWRTRWSKYDFRMGELDAEATRRAIRTSLGEHRDVIAHWTDLFDRVRSGLLDTWDVQWCYTMWKEGWRAFMPRENYITNIGFGDDATHTTDPNTRLSRLKFDVSQMVPPDAGHFSKRSDLADRWRDLVLDHTFKSYASRSLRSLRR